jgi:excisionase family DNA binding protein
LHTNSDLLCPHNPLLLEPAKEDTVVSSRTGPLTPKWYSPAEVAEMLGFGLSKVKMKIATGEMGSIKDGKYRRVLPEWVDEYVRHQVERQEAA